MTGAEIDAALAADPDFAAVCDAHREAFVAREALAANDGAGFTTESFWTGVRA